MEPEILKEGEIRSLLTEYVSHKRLYSSDAVKKMEFTVINPTITHYYNLQSMSEGRTTRWLCEPYKQSSYYDGIQNGPVPEAWDIVIPAADEFTDHKITASVPHTDHVEVCQVCTGTGRVTCSRCGGRGRVSTSST